MQMWPRHRESSDTDGEVYKWDLRPKSKEWAAAARVCAGWTSHPTARGTCHLGVT